MKCWRPDEPVEEKPERDWMNIVSLGIVYVVVALALLMIGSQYTRYQCRQELKETLCPRCYDRVFGR